MNSLSQKTWAVLALASGMVFFLSRVITLALHFHAPLASPAVLRPTVAVRPRAVRHASKHPSEKALVIHKAVSEQDLNSLHLNSNLHEYNVIFAGQVVCGQDPCAADLDLVSNTPRNENVHRLTQTMEDGNFWVQVPLSEVQNEHVDWKIVARRSDGLSAETHGRDILSEDSVVSIDTRLTLR